MVAGIGRYKDFAGIPFLHVVILFSINIFSIFFFHQYLICGKKILLLKSLIFLFLNILYVNRGAFLIVLMSLFILYLMKKRTINLFVMFKVVIGVIAVIYCFGLLGNIREEASRDNENKILQIGGASDTFINSGIPSHFYWGYLYAISPLGNLQNLIDNKYSNTSDANSWLSCLCSQFLPDFLSKRVLAFFVVEQSKNYLVSDSLNAPTVYYGVFYSMGWIGMFLMFYFQLLVYVVYISCVSKESPFYLTGVSVIISTTFFNTFNNMWYHTGLSMLFLVIILSVLNRIKLKIK